VLRTILILKYGMNTNDAIQFLGGPETDRFRHVLILYLLKDNQHMREAFNDYNSTTTSGAAWVIASWLRCQILDPAASIKDKDLKLPGAKTIQKAVREKLSPP
jgi:hypothetical protein